MLKGTLLLGLILCLIADPLALIQLCKGQSPELQSTSNATSKSGESGAAGPGRKPLDQDVPPGTPVQLPQGPGQEILNVVVQEHRANLGRMQTWEGSATVTDKMTREKQVISKATYEIDFAVDRVHDMLRWNRRTVAAIGLQDGKEVVLAPEDLPLESVLRKGDDLYRLGPRKPNAKVRIISVNTSRALNLAPASTDFDPLYFFTANGLKLDERFQFFYEESGSPAFSWKIKRNNDRVTVESDVGTSHNRYVVDLSKGANLIELYLLDRDQAGKETLECKATWEYEKISDVWVPKRMVYYNDYLLHANRIDRTIDWRKRRVNESLPDDAFTLTTLGAQSGDEVVDMRSGIRARVPNEAADPAPVSAAPMRGTDDYTLRFWLIVSTGILLLFLTAILLARKCGRQQHAA